MLKEKLMAKLKNNINRFIYIHIIHYLYKFTTQTIWLLAHLYCKLWYFFRCKIRNKSDFDYFIKNLSKQYEDPVIAVFSLFDCRFFNKEVLVDDEFERSCAVKIGSVEVTYSFDKLKRKPTNLSLFYDSPKWEITRALLEMTRQTHHKASVLEFSKQHRKEDSYGKNKHRKSSS